MWTFLIGFVVLLCASLTNGFVPVPTIRNNVHPAAMSMAGDSHESEPVQDCIVVGAHRRSFLSSFLGGALLLSGFPAVSAAEDDETFASIAARAAKLSSDVGERSPQVVPKSDDPRTAYDFSLPVAGETLQFRDIVHQQTDTEGRSKVKAILVVNMKEDDPIARKDIPEFMSLASKYGRDGEFVVIMSPSDQGYYEPDTSQLIRLKLASEYGYGINPATVLTDKVNFLGTGAHPFWRWLQKTCRNPLGIGRLEGNYEKFLLDGRSGLPLRRYPRKYKPTDMKNDIEALIAGRPIPPAGANYNEQWRAASVEAERDTYRFQKGLNYFDQQAE
mmetsp:Transcript_41529/g.117608  ORF Transcript_41529/g.117608 Transcript_41529/m.117608 type:complete len:331 (-) Transcript_41529:151-1143(-)